MQYLEFLKKAKELDSRNTFEKYSGDLDMLPDSIKDFYKEANPIDVELTYDGCPIKLCSMQEQEWLKGEYPEIRDKFIVATCNGDPLFIDGEKIYVYPHGYASPEFELVFEDFDLFLKSLITI